MWCRSIGSRFVALQQQAYEGLLPARHHLYNTDTYNEMVRGQWLAMC